MIRFFSLLPRKEGVSEQEFHDHWRHPHGTLGRLIPGLNDYVQAHRVQADELDPGSQTRFDGVAVSSFDSPRAADGLLTDPQYVEHVAPDEPNFQDLSRVLFLSTEEEVLVSRAAAQNGHFADPSWDVLHRPTSVQLLQFVEPDGPTGWAKDTDESLGNRIGAFRHARNRPSKEVHGSKPPLLGARQLWWPTLSHFRRGAAGDQEAFQALVSQAPGTFSLLTIAERFVR